MDEFAELFDSLTENARASLAQADFWSYMTESDFIGTEHLLLGILSREQAVATEFLQAEGVTIDKLQAELPTVRNQIGPRKSVIKVLSEAARITLHMGYKTAREYNDSHFGTEHILFAILSQRQSRAVEMIEQIGVDVDALVGKLRNYFNHQLLTKTRRQMQVDNLASERRMRRKKSVLSAYGTNLTEQAVLGQLDPVVGRASEIERLATVLSRRTKSNPILIGEPGVGKTAIVEGLAQKIANAEVSASLLEAQIIQIDLAGVVAGTKFRGEFEERFKKIIAELSSDPHLIGFIDELHLLIGAGASEGSIDAANILKPALARGQIRLIGATTFDEYRKYIEKDSALERRFQTIDVPEPTPEQAVAMLKGVRQKYQTHHQIEFSDDLAEDAVYLANKYLSDRRLPDKAIDLIDEAAAWKRVNHDKVSPEVRRKTYKINRLEMKIDQALENEDYETAAKSKQELDELMRERKQAKTAKTRRNKIRLASDDLARVVSLRTGIPVAKVKKSQQTTLLNLEKVLSKRIIGQEAAIAKVSQAIRRARSGVSDSRRPIGSFIFMGPSGVGKTELAKVLADEMFGGRDALVKIDMSEFSEKHSLSQLLGAPAGYVGYEDGAKLTDAVRRRPYQVILFDEIEKAHGDVFNILLQLLEDGSLTDAKGRVVNFANTIVILTSNLGSEEFTRKDQFGFGESDQQSAAKADFAHRELERFMRPELINRFDDVLVFEGLSTADLGKIFDNFIDDLNSRLRIKGFSLKVQAAVKRRLIKQAEATQTGARPLRRLIENELEHLIAEALIADKFSFGQELVAKLTKQKIVIDGKEISSTQRVKNATK